jgi:undecaprenyl-diphosphatase
MGGVGGQVLVASFFAFCVGLMAIHFLITYLKKHSLSIFAWYRIVLALALIAFSFWK